MVFFLNQFSVAQEPHTQEAREPHEPVFPQSRSPFSASLLTVPQCLLFLCAYCSSVPTVPLCPLFLCSYCSSVPTVPLCPLFLCAYCSSVPTVPL